jgi:hypothetical protein
MFEPGTAAFSAALSRSTDLVDPTTVQLLDAARERGRTAADLVAEAVLGAGDHADDV